MFSFLLILIYCRHLFNKVLVLLRVIWWHLIHLPWINRLAIITSEYGLVGSFRFVVMTMNTSLYSSDLYYFHNLLSSRDVFKSALECWSLNPSPPKTLKAGSQYQFYSFDFCSFFSFSKNMIFFHFTKINPVQAWFAIRQYDI